MRRVQQRQRFYLIYECAIAALVFAVNVCRNAATDCDAAVARLDWQMKPSGTQESVQHAQRDARFDFNNAVRRIKIQDPIERTVLDRQDTSPKARSCVRQTCATRNAGRRQHLASPTTIAIRPLQLPLVPHRAVESDKFAS